jgi:hypothetical protein
VCVCVCVCVWKRTQADNDGAAALEVGIGKGLDLGRTDVAEGRARADDGLAKGAAEGGAVDRLGKGDNGVCLRLGNVEGNAVVLARDLPGVVGRLVDVLGEDLADNAEVAAQELAVEGD